MEAPNRARRSLAYWYGDLLDDQELADASLVLSELVNNAVVHGIGLIRMRAELDEHRLRIQVMDQGSGFEYTHRDVGAFDGIRGRGLSIVDALSSRWGISEGSTQVWAEIEHSLAGD